MSDAKAIAWASVARGQDFDGRNFYHVIAGSTQSRKFAEKEAERVFRKKWPEARLLGTTTLEIHEGE